MRILCIREFKPFFAWFLEEKVLTFLKEAMTLQLLTILLHSLLHASRVGMPDAGWLGKYCLPSVSSYLTDKVPQEPYASQTPTAESSKPYIITRLFLHNSTPYHEGIFSPHYQALSDIGGDLLVNPF